MQPVAESLRIAKQIFPELARVGVVWNPAEVNSEINTRLARDACRDLKIELLEANAESTAAVKEAAASLVGREVDALWIGGDVTVLAAVDVVVRTAKQAAHSRVYLHSRQCREGDVVRPRRELLRSRPRNGSPGRPAPWLARASPQIPVDSFRSSQSCC